jgi:6-phosphofructokinase 1
MGVGTVCASLRKAAIVLAWTATHGSARRVIAAGATVANQDVNFTLIPEVPFKLDGPNGLLSALKERLKQRAHAVVVVAEGAGQELFEDTPTAMDSSGNIKLKDIGLILRERIEAYFKEANIPIVMRYFDPSYLIRSSRAIAADSVLCDLYARNAVHAAMAGKTGLVIGFLHDAFIHIPIEMLVVQKKQIDPDGLRWKAVLAVTGQPARFASGVLDFLQRPGELLAWTK